VRYISTPALVLAAMLRADHSLSKEGSTMRTREHDEVLINHAKTGKLATMQAVGPTVLSLYLAIPADVAGAAGLTARAHELIEAAGQAGSSPPRTGGGSAGDEDVAAVLTAVAAGGRDWHGHTVAIFACASLSLFEVRLLPGDVPECAVLGPRPHVRPLLAALQGSLSYRVAVLDGKRAWFFSVAADEKDARPDADRRGELICRVRERFIRFGQPPYSLTSAFLEQLSDDQPLVVGGPETDVRRFLASAPPPVGESVAGSFVADPRALTPAGIAALGTPVMAGWAALRARRLAASLRELPPGFAARGLDPCLAAVNVGAVDLLAVPSDGRAPGYLCGRCGALSSTGAGCSDRETATLPIPDLIDEMVSRTLADDGQVCVVRGGSGDVTARLRFPGALFQAARGRRRDIALSWREAGRPVCVVDEPHGRHGVLR
jgi:hypothetical protein